MYFEEEDDTEVDGNDEEDDVKGITERTLDILVVVVDGFIANGGIIVEDNDECEEDEAINELYDDIRLENDYYRVPNELCLE